MVEHNGECKPFDFCPSLYTSSSETCGPDEVHHPIDPPSCGGKSDYFCCDTSSENELQVIQGICKADPLVPESCDLTASVAECACPDGMQMPSGLPSYVEDENGNCVQPEVCWEKFPPVCPENQYWGYAKCGGVLSHYYCCETPNDYMEDYMVYSDLPQNVCTGPNLLCGYFPPACTCNEGKTKN